MSCIARRDLSVHAFKTLKCVELHFWVSLRISRESEGWHVQIEKNTHLVFSLLLPSKRGALHHSGTEIFSSRDMRSQKQVLQRITGNDFVDLVGIGSRVSRINFKKKSHSTCFTCMISIKWIKMVSSVPGLLRTSSSKIEEHFGCCFFRPGNLGVFDVSFERVRVFKKTTLTW